MLLTPQERLYLKEKGVQILEACLYGAVAGVVSAILEFCVHPQDTPHELWEVARAAAVGAGVLYFKHPHRDPYAHSDRDEDKFTR
jgi:hypothetical protein